MASLSFRTMAREASRVDRVRHPPMPVCRDPARLLVAVHPAARSIAPAVVRAPTGAVSLRVESV